LLLLLLFFWLAVVIDVVAAQGALEGLWGVFGRALGCLWEGFEMTLGRLWDDFGRALGCLWQGFGEIFFHALFLHFFGALGFQARP